MLTWTQSISTIVTTCDNTGHTCDERINDDQCQTMIFSLTLYTLLTGHQARTGLCDVSLVRRCTTVLYIVCSFNSTVNQ